VRAPHGDGRRRAPARRRASRGSASVEYGLIIALIGAVLCLGIGVAVKSVFQETVTCFLEQLNSSGTSPECADSGGTDGGGGTGGTGDGDGGGSSATPKASPSGSATPTPTPTPSPDPSPTPAPTTTP
jgi:Flp pilus assembly pilin Flp